MVEHEGMRGTHPTMHARSSEVWRIRKKNYKKEWPCDRKTMGRDGATARCLPRSNGRHILLLKRHAGESCLLVKQGINVAVICHYGILVHSWIRRCMMQPLSHTSNVPPFRVFSISFFFVFSPFQIYLHKHTYICVAVCIPKRQMK